MVRHEVQQTLRNKLKSPITALLLSCEMALRVPDLQSQAKSRMRAIHELAQEVRRKLDGLIRRYRGRKST
jgi:hypothetical protein